MAKAKEIKKPEIVPDAKISPSDTMAIEDEKKVKAPGNWIAASYEELIQHEKNGNIIGWDAESGTVLLKDK